MRSLLIVIFIFFLSGCATTQAPNPQLVNRLQVRVSELENKLDQRNQEIEELKYEVKELAYQVESLDMSPVIEPTGRYKSTTHSSKKTLKKSKKDEKIIRVNVQLTQIQKVLKNAGYYRGAIDGKIGSQTKQAIRRFQKDHHLKSDGIIGKQTWAEMKNYLD